MPIPFFFNLPLRHIGRECNAAIQFFILRLLCLARAVAICRQDRDRIEGTVRKLAKVRLLPTVRKIDYAARKYVRGPILTCTSPNRRMLSPSLRPRASALSGLRKIAGSCMNWLSHAMWRYLLRTNRCMPAACAQDARPGVVVHPARGDTGLATRATRQVDDHAVSGYDGLLFPSHPMADTGLFG